MYFKQQQQKDDVGTTGRPCYFLAGQKGPKFVVSNLTVGITGFQVIISKLQKLWDDY